MTTIQIILAVLVALSVALFLFFELVRRTSKVDRDEDALWAEEQFHGIADSVRGELDERKEDKPRPRVRAGAFLTTTRMN